MGAKRKNSKGIRSRMKLGIGKRGGGYGRRLRPKSASFLAWSDSRLVGES